MGESKNGTLSLEAGEYLVSSGSNPPKRVRFGVDDSITVDDISVTVSSPMLGRERERHVLVNGTVYRVSNVEWTGDDQEILSMIVNGIPWTGSVDDRRSLLRRSGMAQHRSSTGPMTLMAPMPGMVVKVLIREGEDVEAGQPVALLEAMKMENEIRAVRKATILKVIAVAGRSVEKGDPLFELSPII